MVQSEENGRNPCCDGSAGPSEGHEERRERSIEPQVIECHRLGPCQDGHETQTSDSAQSPATGQQLGFNISTTQCLGRSGQQSVPWVWDMGQVEKDVLRASNGRCGVMAHGAGNKDSQKSGSEFGYTLKALPAFLLTPLQFLIAQISRKKPQYFKVPRSNAHNAFSHVFASLS